MTNNDENDNTSDYISNTKRYQNIQHNDVSWPIKHTITANTVIISIIHNKIFQTLSNTTQSKYHTTNEGPILAYAYVESCFPPWYLSFSLASTSNIHAINIFSTMLHQKCNTMAFDWENVTSVILFQHHLW